MNVAMVKKGGGGIPPLRTTKDRVKIDVMNQNEGQEPIEGIFNS